jgi:hypothetical protein
MKRFALLAAVVLATLGSTTAPADEYFGKMKMSAIRIRYDFMQLQPRYEKHQLLPEEADHLATLAEDAYYAWAAKYPKDPWLASTGYLMARIFAELPGTDARDRAVHAYTYVKSHFPNTTYAKESVAALHRGVPVRPDPSWAVAMRAAQPSPSPSSTSSPSPAPSGSASAGASPSPAPSPSPS